MFVCGTTTAHADPSEFHLEVAFLTKIRHPNVVLFMGASTDPDMCIVTEFCDQARWCCTRLLWWLVALVARSALVFLVLFFVLFCFFFFFFVCVLERNPRPPPILITASLSLALHPSYHTHVQGALYDLIQSGQTLTQYEIYRVVSDTAKGMTYLHSVNIIHRDLKVVRFGRERSGRVCGCVCVCVGVGVCVCVRVCVYM